MHNLLVACAIVSITANPLLFRAIGPIERWLQSRPMIWKLLTARSSRTLWNSPPSMLYWALNGLGRSVNVRVAGTGAWASSRLAFGGSARSRAGSGPK